MAYSENLTLYSIACFFLIYAFLGWCLEVVFCSINTGKFVNRGFLNGPVCPIYGIGATVVVLVLSPISQKLLLLFIGSVILTSLLELATGFLLKKLFHTSWWDYSDQPFNIGGYICLKFSLAWGVACIFLMRVLHPIIEGLVHLVPQAVGLVFLLVCYLLLLCDLVVTVAAIAKLNQKLGEIDTVAAGLRKGSSAIAESLGNSAISIAKKIEDLELEGQKQKLLEKVEEGKQKASSSIKETKEKLTSTLDHNAVTEKLEELFARGTFIQRRLFRAFPNSKNTKYSAALEDLKAYFANTPKGKAKASAKKQSDSPAEEDK